MNYEIFVCEMKELTFQELSNNGVTTEEQFQDKIHDILGEEIENEISGMQLVEIDEIVHNYGISKAISLYIDNFGELHPSSEEHWGKGVYTPALVYQIIFQGVMDSALWEEYQEYKDEEKINIPEGVATVKECDESDEEDEEDEEEINTHEGVVTVKECDKSDEEVDSDYETEQMPLTQVISANKLRYEWFSQCHEKQKKKRELDCNECECGMCDKCGSCMYFSFPYRRGENYKNW